MELFRGLPEEKQALDSQPDPAQEVDIYDELDVNNSNDRLLHLVAMAFDNLALSAGYGGIIQCPYDVDDEEEDSIYGDDAFSSTDGREDSSEDPPCVAAEEIPFEICVEEEDSPVWDEASGVKRVRTSLGIDDVAIDMAGKPLAVASATSGDETALGIPILYTSEFLRVRKSNLGGFGAFAAKDLPSGQHILMEKVLFHADYSSSIDEFNSLSSTDQQLFLDLHGNNPDDDTMEARIKATFFTNNFTCAGRAGAGVFLVGSRFNHACSARCNVKYAYDLGTDAMIFTIGKRGVKAGEELTICYGKDRETLKAQYGFDCQCGACDSTLHGYVEEEFGKVLARLQQS